MTCTMRAVGKFYCGLSCVFSCLQSPVLLFFRLVWGYLFIMAGWHKIAEHGISATAQGFASLGIPLPYFNAILVSGVEIIGGALLVIGLLSRLASIPLIIILVVAYMTAHHEAVANLFQNPNAFFQEAPWNFLVATVLVLVFGPGCFSIDYLWKRCCKKDNDKCCPSSHNDKCCPSSHCEEKK